MARQYAVDDSEWSEVMYINGYAVFMGYLMRGVRVLGLLVITWTTVVLLGGFVSDLVKKDFWCLTGIMLIQTVGVFNFLLKEKINDMVHSWWGLFSSLLATLEVIGAGRKRLVTFFVLVAIQVLVFGVILGALGVVYMLGMYVSAGVSLWRLIEHDFGDAGGANQRPALQVLYILAVAQGVLFGYKAIYALVTGSRLTNMFVAAGWYKELTEEYIEKTVAGCEKNISLATGRNFITYGVDLMMEAKSNAGFIAGIRALGCAVNDNKLFCWRGAFIKGRAGRMVLLKYLLTRSSDSSSAIIQKLLEAVGPRSPYSREIKEHAVRILDIVTAHCIRLEQLPRAIECLCSVVDTSMEWTPRNLEDILFTGPEIIDTEESRRYLDKFKDYERVELLEEYEEIYIGRGESNYSRRTRLLLGLLNQCFRYKRWCHRPRWWRRCERLLYGCLQFNQMLPEDESIPSKRKDEVENEREENNIWGFDQLLIKAANIIYKLVADEYNRLIMLTCVSNTMLQKIALLPSKLHRENHYPCRVFEKSELQMLEQCWVLTEWLSVALTETSRTPLLPAATPVGHGKGRSEEIEEVVEGGDGEEQLLLRSMDGSAALGSTIKCTIKNSIESTIKCIFDCLDCSATQKKQGIQILLHLSLDMSFIAKGSESSKRILSWILLLIFCSTDDDSKYWMLPSLTQNKNSCDFDGIRKLAGEKLTEILREKHGELPSEESAREIQLIHLALGDLKGAFDADTEDISIRTHAIIIMEGLCYISFRKKWTTSYLNQNTRYSEVEGFLVDAIPEVIKEILNRCGSITAERQEQATDVEKGNVSQDNRDDCKDNKRLRKALASLCYFGYMDSYDGIRNYNYYRSTLRPEFLKIAPNICEKQGMSVPDFRRLLLQSIK